MISNGESKSETHRKICLLSPLLFQLRILATKLLESKLTKKEEFHRTICLLSQISVNPQKDMFAAVGCTHVHSSGFI